MRTSSNIVTMPAKIDMTNTADVSDDVAEAIATDARVVIADLSATTFCDSAGIRSLLVMAYQAADSDAELRLVVQANGAVQRIIDLMGLNRLLPVYPTVDAALVGDPRPGQLPANPG
jgi:anti-sigma B factor antagonist